MILASRVRNGCGISSRAVLRLAGLSSEFFQQSPIWLTAEEMRALYEAIGGVSDEPAAGLRLGAEERAENYSPISIPAQLKQYLTSKSLKEQANGMLKRSLAGQRPRLEDVPLELCMSARTLQRKLLDHGTTFHAMMEEARHEMAQHYLRQPSLELNETAYLLGYEDPNSFIRAFHKWEGTSPGDWRSTHSQIVQ